MPRSPKFDHYPKPGRHDKPRIYGDEDLADADPAVQMDDLLALARAVKQASVEVGMGQAVTAPILHYYSPQNAVWQHATIHGASSPSKVDWLTQRSVDLTGPNTHYIWAGEVQSGPTRAVAAFLADGRGRRRLVVCPYTVNGTTITWGTRIEGTPTVAMRTLLEKTLG